MIKVRLLSTGIIMLLVAVLSACRMQDVREAELRIPALRAPECATIISNSLARTPGIMAETMRVDYDAGTVLVRYDSMILALKNIEIVIADAGFAVNNVPADEQARAALPPGCRGDAPAAE